MLNEVKTILAQQHDLPSSPMRWGYYIGGAINSSGGCFYGMQDSAGRAESLKAPYFYTVFHGDGAELPFEALRCTKTFNEAMKKYTRGFNEFQGTERTLRWVKFLLSDASPWRLLVPFFAETDPGYINQAGFIWKDLPKIPKKLWYNFVMAYRLPWEFPKAFGLWLALVDAGHHPALSLYIVLNFELNETAKDISGPYDLVYPWSALEETCYEAVGRFVLGAPASVSVAGPMSPNVHPLWQIKEPTATARANVVFSKFNEAATLSLAEIVVEMEGLIKDQKEVIDASSGGTQ